MKTDEDNLLKATCELHVFWIIITAFVMKSDLSHEQLGDDFYDAALILSFIVCVPLMFLVSVASKLQRENMARLDEEIHGVHQDRRRSGLGASSPTFYPRKEFRRYTLGLASMDDRLAIRAYFQAMLSSHETLQTGDSAHSQAGLSSKAPIVDMLEMLGYPESEHEAILKKLAEEHPRRSVQKRVARCCALRNQDPTSMLIFIEQADGEGAPIKLSLERDRSWTIHQLKEKIFEEQEASCCRHWCHEGEMADSLELMKDGRRLRDNETVADCGIDAGDKLQINENGITFKKLAKYYVANPPPPATPQPANSTLESVDGQAVQEQPVHHPDTHTGLGGIQEPLVSATRPASPDTSNSARLGRSASLLGDE